MDFAKMLQEMGVDRVIAVDIQRPGQGSEACFFDNKMPVEAIMTTDDMVDHFIRHIDLKEPIVVVTPNSECVKKARNFQLRLQKAFSTEVKLVAFFPSEAYSGPTEVDKLELIGKAQVYYAIIF
jgi:ribose-phosphate pyrophosphokinase